MPAAVRQIELAAVGRDGKPAAQRTAAGKIDGDAIVIGAHRVRLRVEVYERGRFGHAPPQRRDQMGVLDIPGKRLQPEFGGFEPHLRSAPEPAGIVDDAHDAQRRGIVAAGRPHPEGIERGHRRRHQGRGAIIDPVRPQGDQHGRNAALRQCQRRDEPGRAAADHRRVGGSGLRRRYERAGFGLGGHVVNPLRGRPHHGPVMTAVSIRAARWVARAACGA